MQQQWYLSYLFNLPTGSLQKIGGDQRIIVDYHNLNQTVVLTASCMTGILLLLKISACVSFTISKMNHKKFIFILNRKIYTLAILPQGYVKHPQLFLDIIQRYLDHLDIRKNITLIYYIIVTMLISKMVKRCLTLEYLV